MLTSQELQQDLLPESDHLMLPRSGLLPAWFHVVMSVLILFHLLMIGVSIPMFKNMFIVGSEAGYALVVTGVVAFVLLFGGNIVGSILMWTRWKYALTFTIIPAVLLSFLLIAVIATFVMNKESKDEIFFALPYFLLQIGFMLRIFWMAREWKSRFRG
ncbi:hypothetical protein WJU16_23560 [Chitinophaga pollutisoli]|uniref:Uncharacterized protein n=1 Tax=Chitinophaga pollutisoli TaxID=3133966 RepID=A0ABZ2YMG1_9BACT